jgi:hypothetical protein
MLSERKDGSYLVMGISPLSCLTNADEDITVEMRSKLAPLINFKQFFKLAAKHAEIQIRSNCKYFLDRLFSVLTLFHVAFDPNVVEVHRDVAQDFVGAVNEMLKRATPNYFSSSSSNIGNWRKQD